MLRKSVFSMKKTVFRERKMMLIAKLLLERRKKPRESVRAPINVSSKWKMMTLRPNAKKQSDKLRMLAGRRRRKTEFSNNRKLKDSD